MWRAGVERAVAGVISLLASLILIFVGPELAAAGPVWQAVALLVATLSFYAIFEALLWLVARWRLRHVLGAWLYVTWPEQGRKDLRYGLMELKLNGLELDYGVRLFDTMSALLAAAKNRGAGGGTIGEAKCMAMRYHEDDKKVYIFWGADFSEQDEPQRYGSLTLRVQGGRRLDGEWSSNPDKKTTSRGGMVAARKAKLFQTAHDEAIAHQIQKGVLKRVGDDVMCASYASPPA